MAQLDFLEEQIAIFDTQIIERIAGQPAQDEPPGSDDRQPGTPGEAEAMAAAPLTWQAAVTLLDTIPGVGRRIAEVLVAEIGTHMCRFPSAAHLASWAKLAPGNNESAGKRYSSKTGAGNRWLRSCLVQAAHAAVRVRDCYLGAVYHRLAGRRGLKRAIIAVAHRVLTAAYYMLLRHEPFQDPGAATLSERNKARTVKRITRPMEKLGYRVVVQPLTVPATSTAAP